MKIFFLNFFSLICFRILEIIGANVGLAITQILNLITTIQWGIRQTAELENYMTSVERVMEYTNLKPEKDQKIEPKPDEKMPDFSNWAKKGEIEFKDLSLKYSEDSNRILKSLNLRIKSGEKIGICGRTGAGKSSIIQAIFRLAVNEGCIKIDGIDISSVPLYQLRKNISIIPQESILFSGTMRDNLDPFHESSDDELWRALDQVSFHFSRYNPFFCVYFFFRFYRVILLAGRLENGCQWNAKRFGL